jgi:putative DNA primase/helicase
VTASETEEGRTWDEVKVKQLTGGDDIRTRFMRENSFTVRPNFKLLFVGNSTPNMAHLDDAWRRRFHLAEFNHKPANPDMDLELKLEDEYPAILSWMIDGCIEWQQIGLHPPASVIKTTQEYFSEQDVFGAWLREQCDVEPGNLQKKEKSARLYESWCSYAKTHQHEPGTVKGFSASMKRKGLHPKPIKALKSRGYEGIQLNQGSGWEDR